MLDIIKLYLVRNDCFKKAAKLEKVEGVVKHSSGANNPFLSRYIGTNSVLGTNKYGNHWNRSGVTKCVHFMIGKDANGNVRCYQLLPLDYQCWGCGSGKKGSYNRTHIQYEILEDGLSDKKYFEEAFAIARELDAYLCKKFNLTTDKIVSHKEASKNGYASNHADCDHWLKLFGRTMDDERAAVKKMLTVTTSSPSKSQSTSSSQKDSFKVKITCGTLNVRKGPGTKNAVVMTVKKNEVYTIVETKNGWGKLKSGAGWINISTKYVKRV